VKFGAVLTAGVFWQANSRFILCGSAGRVVSAGCGTLIRGDADGGKMRLLRQDHPGRISGLHDLREENEPGEPDKAPVPSFSEEGEEA
jgi:hypothetical protein